MDIHVAETDVVANKKVFMLQLSMNIHYEKNVFAVKIIEPVCFLRILWYVLFVVVFCFLFFKLRYLP